MSVESEDEVYVFEDFKTDKNETTDSFKKLKEKWKKEVKEDIIVTTELSAIAFLYSHKKKDENYQTIKDILALKFGKTINFQNCSSMSDVVDVIVNCEKSTFILNGHGNGGLDFRIKKGKTFNFQVGYGEDYSQKLELSFLAVLNSVLKKKKKKINLLLLSCHIGQVKDINFMNQISEITLYTIASEFSLSFKNTFNILKYIEKHGFQDGTEGKVTLKDKHFVYKTEESEEYLKKVYEAYLKLREKQNDDELLKYFDEAFSEFFEYGDE